MIWVAVVVLAGLSLAPALWSVRGSVAARGRRDSAVALHRAQLAELDRDLGEGRIAAPEHARARLEVQRRLLAEAERPEAAAGRAARAPLVTALVLVPLAAVGLYLAGGQPGLPGAPLAARLAAERGTQARDDALIEDLRRQLATLDQSSPQALQGWRILGQAEASRGRWAQAGEAWRRSLAIRFDPTIAAEAAEAATRAEGRVSAQSAGLFRQALDGGPGDAPWHEMAVNRLAEASHQK